MSRLAPALVLGRCVGPHGRIHGERADLLRCRGNRRQRDASGDAGVVTKTRYAGVRRSTTKEQLMARQPRADAFIGRLA